MSVTKKVNALNAAGKSIDEKLYMVLSAMDFTQNGYRVSELGGGMSVIEQVIWGWWKQRYLIDNKNCRAYEIMDGNMDFVNCTTDDIDGHSSQLLLGNFEKVWPKFRGNSIPMAVTIWMTTDSA